MAKNERCDACGLKSCIDKHLCDVRMPHYPCPSGKDPHTAILQARRVAFPREYTGPKPRKPKWPAELVTEVQARVRAGQSYGQVGLALNLGGVVGSPEATRLKAKNAVAAIIRQYGKGEES